MQVIRLELMVLDFDGLGVEEVKTVLENTKYPNHCIAPSVMAAEAREIGEWDDNHPLNFKDQQAAEFRRLFGEKL